jgi:hypothetical protein
MLTPDGRDVLVVRVVPAWTGLSVELRWHGERARPPRLPVAETGSCWSSDVHEGERQRNVARIDYFQPEDAACSDPLLIDLQDVATTSSFGHRALRAPGYRLAVRLDGRQDSVVTAAAGGPVDADGASWTVERAAPLSSAAGAARTSCTSTDAAAGDTGGWRCTTEVDPADGATVDAVVQLPGASYDLADANAPILRDLLLVGTGVLAAVVAGAILEAVRLLVPRRR